MRPRARLAVALVAVVAGCGSEAPAESAPEAPPPAVAADPAPVVPPPPAAGPPRWTGPVPPGLDAWMLSHQAEQCASAGAPCGDQLVRVIDGLPFPYAVVATTSRELQRITHVVRVDDRWQAIEGGDEPRPSTASTCERARTDTLGEPEARDLVAGEPMEIVLPYTWSYVGADCVRVTHDELSVCAALRPGGVVACRRFAIASRLGPEGAERTEWRAEPSFDGRGHLTITTLEGTIPDDPLAAEGTIEIVRALRESRAP